MSEPGVDDPPISDNLTRRKLVAGTVTLAAVTATGSRARDSADYRTLLAGLISDRETAGTLGRAYLAGGGDPVRLRSKLEGLLTTGRPSLAAARRLVREQRQADLGRSEIVVVDGWLLARAEAELFALLASA